MSEGQPHTYHLEEYKRLHTPIEKNPKNRGVLIWGFRATAKYILATESVKTQLL